jgi:hypothetical protein
VCSRRDRFRGRRVQDPDSAIGADADLRGDGKLTVGDTARQELTAYGLDDRDALEPLHVDLTREQLV